MKKQKLLIVLMTLCLPLANTAHAAKLMFSGADSMIKNCPSQVDIYIDSQEDDISTAGVNIVLYEDQFIVNEFLSNQGVFRLYPEPKMFTAREGDFAGKQFLRLIGSTSSANGYEGIGKFGTLTITPTADQVNLDFYMLPDFEGEDSNLVTDIDGNSTDVLTSIENKVIQVKEGECKVATLPALELTDIEGEIFADDALYKLEDTMQVNEENIFDKNQEAKWIKKNINYIAIVIALLIVAVLLVVLIKNKPEKKNEKNKQ